MRRREGVHGPAEDQLGLRDDEVHLGRLGLAEDHGLEHPFYVPPDMQLAFGLLELRAPGADGDQQRKCLPYTG